MSKTVSLHDGRVLSLVPPTPDDALSLIAFHETVGGETDFLLSDEHGIPGLTESGEREYIEATLGMANTRMWLGFVEGELVCLCDVRGEARPRIAHNGGIGVVVKRAYWGLGVGTALMETMLAFARENEVLTRLHLDVRADNGRAVALYRRFGFVEYGRAHRYMRVNGECFDMIQMELLL